MVRHGIGSFIRFQATLGVGINGYSRIGNAVWVYSKARELAKSADGWFYWDSSGV